MEQVVKKGKGRPRKFGDKKGAQIYVYVSTEHYAEANKKIRELLKQYR